MSALIHPLRLLSRTDVDISSLYHCFYFIEVGYGNQIEIVQRVPKEKSRGDEDIESGIKFFISEIAVEPFYVEAFGNFVLTSSDGSRFNAFWRAFGKRVFVAITKLFLLSFSRDLFQQLYDVNTESLGKILLTLCETPIVPVSGLSYSIQVSSLHMDLNFSKVEFPEDVDINATILAIFTPKMLVGAWEAIILERKVLVASSNSAIIAPSCEFLRRLVVPLTIINTYVPYLTYQLINALDSPLPFLVGANTHMVRESKIDLSETVVIDLDGRSVHSPRMQYGKVEKGAPVSIVSKLLKDLSVLMTSPLQTWLNRASSGTSTSSSGFGGSTFSHAPSGPLSTDYVNTLADAVLQLFVNTNLNILSARASSGESSAHLPSFFKRNYSSYLNPTKPKESTRLSSDYNHTMGYKIANEIASGTMQLLRQRYASDSAIHFLPCWIELDDCTFSVYEHADETPILCFLNKDICSVAPSPMEPEGHIFEIAFSNSRIFRFATTDPDSRRLWMSFIEEKMRRSDYIDAAPATVSGSTRDAQSPSGAGISSVSPLVGGPNTGSGSFAERSEADPAKDPLAQLFGNVDCFTNSVEEELCISKFRLQVKKTQMFSYMHSQFEASRFENAFKKIGITPDALLSLANEINVEKYLWEGSTVVGLVDKISTRVTASLPPATTRTSARSTPASSLQQSKSASTIAVSEVGLSSTPTEKHHDLSHLSTLVLDGVTTTESSVPDESNDSEFNSSFKVNSDSSSTNRHSMPISKSLSGVSASVNSTRGNITTTVSAKLPGKASSSTSSQSKRSLFGMFKLSFRSSVEDSTAHPVEQTAANSVSDTERELFEEKKRMLTRLLQHIAASNRRVEEELHRALVEDRIGAVSRIVAGPLSRQTTSFSPVEVVLKVDFPTHNIKDNVTINPIQATWFDKLWSSVPFMRDVQSRVSTVESMSVPAEEQANANLLAVDTEVEDCDPDDDAADVSGDDEEYASPAPHAEIIASESLSLKLKAPDEEITKKDNDFAAITPINEGDFVAIIRRNLIESLQKTLDDLGQAPESENSGTSPRSPFSSVYYTMIGYLHERMSDFDSALLAYASGSLVDQSNITYCLAKRFQVAVGPNAKSGSKDFDNYAVTANSERFLAWAYKLNPLLGLQAYRLITEIIHKQLSEKLSKLLSIENEELYADPAFALGVQRGFSSRSSAPVQNPALSVLWRGSKRVLADGSLPSPITRSRNKEALNEVVDCDPSEPPAEPCALSVNLLIRLRELLRSSFEKMAGTRDRKDGFLRIRLTPDLFDELLASSAFMAFENETAKLQRLDLTALNTQQRLLFFCNIYNCIAAHSSMVLSPKGGIGTNLLERTAFMRNAKYNIGGTLYSMFDIEYGVLRAESASPMIFGPFSPSMSFSERDPRKAYALEIPKPLITFCLFTMSSTSPVLSVLRDAQNVDAELKRCTKLYIQQHVRFDAMTNMVDLPDLFRVFWKDFGGNRANVLNMLRKFHTKAFSDNVKASRPKINFIPMDWTPMFII